MKELNFDTGLITYTINKTCEVTFNPTDTNFIERLYTAFDNLDKKQETYKATIEKMKEENPSEIFSFARNLDTEMRQILDDLFEVPVSEALFGSMNAYAMANGLPGWCNLLLTVMDEIDASYMKEQKAMNPRLAKYTAKYQKLKK